jgi:hypothetical protein
MDGDKTEKNETFFDCATYVLYASSPRMKSIVDASKPPGFLCTLSTQNQQGNLPLRTKDLPPKFCELFGIRVHYSIIGTYINRRKNFFSTKFQKISNPKLSRK